MAKFSHGANFSCLKTVAKTLNALLWCNIRLGTSAFFLPLCWQQDCYQLGHCHSSPLLVEWLCYYIEEEKGSGAIE